MLAPHEYVDKPAVLAWLDLTPKLLNDLVGRRQFPQPIRLSRKTWRWRRSDIEQWVEQRRLASGAKEGV